MAIDRILILGQDETATICEALQRDQYSVTRASTLAAARDLLAKERFDLLLAGCKLPDGSLESFLEDVQLAPAKPLTIVLADRYEDAAACLAKGAWDYSRLSKEEISLVLQKAEKAVVLNRAAQFTGANSGTPSALVGKSPAVEQLRRTIRKVAPSSATVLVQGPAGAGQAEVAEAIWRQGPRGQRPFLHFDCAAIAEHELHLRLFGGYNETGFSSGALELAHEGTLLLESVSALPVPLQEKLLKVIQDRQILSGGRTIQLDVRIIVTTEVSLEKAVKRGEFMEGLLYALNIMPIELPALRERREDIPQLAELYRQRQVRRIGQRGGDIAAASVTALQDYAWPGNLAELNSVVSRASLLCGADGIIEPRHLCLAQGATGQGAPSSANGTAVVLEPLDEIERRHILYVLEQCDGSRTRTAETLGISIRTLRNKLKEYRNQNVTEEEPELAVA